MEIHLFSAQDLPVMDSSARGGKIDAYVVFEFAGAKYKSKIINSTVNPKWCEKISIPYYEPCICGSIQVKLFDWDRGSNDELVGAFSIPYQSKTITSSPEWKNLYGAQAESSNDYAKLMNVNPELGSCWKGRILLSYNWFECEAPKLSSEKLNEKEMQNPPSPQIWSLTADLFYGVGFQKKNEKYSVSVCWAQASENFAALEGKNGYWPWFDRKTLKALLPYDHSREMPDVFIYLVSNKKKIGYIRRKYQDFVIQGKPQIFKFKADRGVNQDLREDEVGFIKLRIWATDPDCSKPVESKYSEGSLYVTLYYGKNLLPADSDGNSDPKVVASYYGKEVSSGTIKETLNPIWCERLVLNNVPIFTNHEDYPPLLLNVYDEDKLGNDFLGSVMVDLVSGIENKYVADGEDDVEPVWLPIKYYNKIGDYSTCTYAKPVKGDNNEIGSINCGELLVSFNILKQKKQTFSPNRNLDVKSGSNPVILETDEYSCKIRVLGLRDLQSLGLLPIKRAYVKFDINSLRRDEEKQALREKGAIKTEPKESGQNPNMLTIIEFSLKLPKDLEKCPFLSCTVHDHIFKGLFQPVLGVFSINLKEFIVKTKNSYVKPIEISQDKIPTSASRVSGQEIHIDKENPKKEQISINLEMPAITKEQKMEEIQKPLLADHHWEKESGPEIDHKYHEKQPRNKDVVDENGVIHSHSIIIKPKYVPGGKSGVEEIEKPDKEKYRELGWDSVATRRNLLKNDDLDIKKRKHYRYKLQKELENSPFMDGNTFDEFTIYRSQRDTKDNFFTSDEALMPKPVGKFKGWVHIMSKDLERDIKMNNLIMRRTSSVKMCHNEKTNDSTDIEFLEQKDVMVRVYVISVNSLVDMDTSSCSDPYIQLRIGKNCINNKQDYRKDQSDVDFFAMFEIKTSLPGSSQLHIEVWDHDDFLSDDLIGETIIDLENRFYSHTWRSIENPPIETRQLAHPDYKNSRGSVDMWLEIIDLSDKKNKEKINSVWEIKPKPPAEFELRVVVWECQDIPNNDVEDASDLYIKGKLGEKDFNTDVHYRSQNGTGSFNWRMIWPITLGLEKVDTILTFQVWDKDILSGNDFISDVSINIKEAADFAFENDSIVKISGSGKAAVGKDGKKDQQKFTIDFKKPEEGANKTGYKNQGNITLSVELVPGAIAKINKVGVGRGEPNHDPWLPPPIGRFEWSWNPFTLFNRCVGPKARRKIFCAIFTILCCAIMISLAPIIIGNAVGNLLTK